MQQVKFVVQERPVPAVRMTQRSKFTKPEAMRYLAYKDSVAWTAKAAHYGLLDGPLVVEIHFYLFGGQTPDTDNLVKGILDGCNGVIWMDDQQVVEIHAYRHRGKPERAEVTVRQLDEQDAAG